MRRMLSGKKDPFLGHAPSPSDRGRNLDLAGVLVVNQQEPRALSPGSKSS
jgi:hypothetical protein